MVTDTFLAFEEHADTPHINLGRVKGDRGTDALALYRQAKWLGGEIDVRQVRVLSSELTPQGPIYTVLRRAKLRT